MKKKVLLITGSMNQTSQMHQIALQLPDYDCWFSQLFTDSPAINFIINNTGLLNSTILSGQFKANSESYLRKHRLQIDYRAKKHQYDLVIYCTDLHIPKSLSKTRSVFVQEGMTDKYTILSKIVQALKLPPILSGGTSLNGSTNQCDVYCVASEGYKRQFAKLGTDGAKIRVTGIPNYDNLEQFFDNDFPHRNYVMVATSDMRETYRYENRVAFIKNVVKLADGKPLLFKLHPNEKFDRAEAEIRKHAPAGTLIYNSGNTNHMIANCDVLITQYSTVVYVGMILGKEVHSYFDIDELKKLSPIQNGGSSATKIAQVCRELLIDRVPLRTKRQQPVYDLEFNN